MFCIKSCKKVVINIIYHLIATLTSYHGLQYKKTIRFIVIEFENWTQLCYCAIHSICAALTSGLVYTMTLRLALRSDINTVIM